VLRAAWRNLLARKLRLLLSTFAIVLGVGFVAGTSIFTDTLDRSFSAIVEGTVGEVVVRPAVEDGGDAQFAGLDARTLPASLVDEVAGAEGVQRADGNLEVSGVFVVDTEGQLIGGAGAPGLAVNYNDAPNAAGEQVATLVDGGWPDGAEQIALDTSTAEQAGYSIGDMVPLVSVGQDAQIEAELVGTIEFTTGLVGATLTVFDTGELQRLFFDGEDVFSDVWVTGDGVSQEELRESVAAEVSGEDIQVLTGDQAAEEQKDAIGQVLSFINTFLYVFVIVALVVGSFLIVNTFSILVAQRSRELALLRALGASRGQVRRLVLLEALAIALIGSTLGVAAGYLIATAIKAIFGQIGLDLSDSPLVFEPTTLLISYAVGIIVTLVAAYLPARRAARVSPIEALRDQVAMPETALRRRLAVGIGLTLLGAAGITVGLMGEGSTGLTLLGIGILGVLLGVALASPVLGRPLLLGLRGLYRRVYGMVGQLAADNALRNPRRTAATASALMIGLALVATMAVLGQSTKASIDKVIATSFTADLVVSNAIGQPFSPAIADDVASIDQVDTVATFRYAPVTVDGSQDFGGATDPAAFADMVTLDVTSGALEDLATDTMLVEQQRAESEDISVGDELTLSLPGGEQPLEVVGIYEQNPAIGTTYLFSLEAFEAGGLRAQDNIVYIDLVDGATAQTVEDEVDAAVADVPLVSVKDQDAFAAEQRGPIDDLLRIIYALLALAVIIAVLGIVNTLALSVIERTREVGLVRAIGMQRSQLRRMVRLESVAIAVLGAVLGVVMGVIFGVLLQQAIADQGIEVLDVPVLQLLAFVVVAAVVGVLAAVLPARRASRLDVLQAIGTE
jgi:putative ABC transport system permease protein